MTELAIISIIFASGWMLITALGMRGWGTIPLGFLVGSFLTVTVSLFLVVTRLATNPGVVLTIVTMLGAGVLFWRVHRLNWPDLVPGLVGVLMLGPIVMGLRSVNLFTYHIDSFRHLVAARLLAQDAYHVASMNLLDKRLLSSASLHSLARIGDEWYLQSYTPILALALVAFILWMLTTLPARVDAFVVAVGALSVIVLVTNNRFVWHSFYINDHLILGAAFLVVSSASWLLAARVWQPPQPLLLALVLALPALVVSRPEGFLLGGLAIAPVLSTDALGLRRRIIILAAYALPTIAWYSYVSIRHAQLGGGLEHVPASAYGPVALALGALMVGMPLIVLRMDSRLRNVVLVAVEVGLWLLVATFAIIDPTTLMDSLGATFRNLVLGAGLWGHSLVVLALITVAVLAFFRNEHLIFLRFPLTASVPLFLLLAYLREGAYRIGPGDSLNRMLIQIVPLTVLYVGAATLSRWMPEAHPLDRDRNLTAGHVSV